MTRNTHYLTTIILILLSAFPVMQTAHADIMDHHNQDKVTGETESGHSFPGDPANTDRIVEITAYDIAFEPVSITVSRGETVKFVVTNTGQLLHELVLGTKSYQKTHAEQMRNLSSTDAMIEHMHDKENGILIRPGETREFTWTFSTDLEQIQFACHVPGHYEAGMFGSVNIL